MPRRKISLLVVFLLALVAFAAAGRVQPITLPMSLAVFVEAMGLIQKHYVREVSISDLVAKALDHAAKQLDEYCAYLPADHFEHIKDKVRGVYGGVGLLLRMKGTDVVVADTVQGMPAYEAGLQREDILRTLNGRSVSGLSISQIVSELKGPLGSGVSLEAERAGRLLSFEMLRRQITVATLEGPRRLTPEIAVIAVHELADRTRSEMETAIERFHKRGYRKLILDLRDNPGGTLEASCALADLFLPAGRLIVAIEGRSASDRLQRMSQSAASREDAPLAVLVNHGTVSGSEILAAAFQDHERAKIIGEGTYGKGSVQTVFPLRDGTALKLTTQHYLSPQGRNIDLHGVQPDILVKDERGPGADAVQQAAVAYLESL